MMRDFANSEKSHEEKTKVCSKVKYYDTLIISSDKSGRQEEEIVKFFCCQPQRYHTLKSVLDDERLRLSLYTIMKRKR
jgi:tellurite resistance-related uncharacterized protein